MIDALTAETARELLDYVPETGVLTWRHRGRKWFQTDRQGFRCMERSVRGDSGRCA